MLNADMPARRLLLPSPQFAAEKFGAGELVDPRPYLVGSMLLTYRKNLHLGKLIPAMG